MVVRSKRSLGINALQNVHYLCQQFHHLDHHYDDDHHHYHDDHHDHLFWLRSSGLGSQVQGEGHEKIEGSENKTT